MVTYRFQVTIPTQIILPAYGDDPVNRETFFEWLWLYFQEKGLLGVHEGTLLSEEATAQGIELDSWTVDSGEALPERDWISKQEVEEAELYFDTKENALNAAQYLSSELGLASGEIICQEPQDWDAEWKASFLNSETGIEIPPFWTVIPPWFEKEKLDPHRKILKINPGAGFGTGTHETTQLCLQALGDLFKKLEPGFHALDFGSGSGILSVGLAILGAKVDAVEIDPLAIDNAIENAEINGVRDKIQYTEKLHNQDKKYSVVMANILRPVLLEFSSELVSRISRGGSIILSGLIESDVASVQAQYEKLLGRKVSRLLEKNEWRCIVFE